MRRVPSYRQLPRGSLSFYDRSPHLPRFKSKAGTRQRNNFQVGYIPNEESLFTPSEANLIEMAREDILFRRRFTQHKDKSETLIFLSVVVLTCFFPLIGLLALWGKFDSTISWYTHGAMHALTRKQRVFIKRQFLAEAVMYPILIIVLAVYYSVGI